jgi:hypothetical protein
MLCHSHEKARYSPTRLRQELASQVQLAQSPQQVSVCAVPCLPSHLALCPWYNPPPPTPCPPASPAPFPSGPRHTESIGWLSRMLSARSCVRTSSERSEKGRRHAVRRSRRERGSRWGRGRTNNWGSPTTNRLKLVTCVVRNGFDVPCRLACDSTSHAATYAHIGFC